MVALRLLPLALVLGSFVPIQAQYKTIYNFGAPGDPSCPESSVIAQTPGGNLITTVASGCNSGQNGAAFEIGFQGANFTILQEFGAAMAGGGLTLGTDQRFHGTTSNGGSRGHGTVYRLSTQPDVVYQHDFLGGADGAYPGAPPIQSEAGDYYGTTSGSASHFAGTVYKIDKTGKYSVLHLFTTTDGAFVSGPLVQGTDGYFYGVTVAGGQYGKGVVFRISSAGDLKVLHHFSGPDGDSPVGPLIQARDGNFYGVTIFGGARNVGVVYKMTPAGTTSVFYDFSVTGSQGNEPVGGIMQATDGNFYGTLWYGSAGGRGSIYRITPAGVFTDLHDFWGFTGALPESTIFQHTSGKLYGLTYSGGTYNNGVLFEYGAGMGPFVRYLNVYGQVGAQVDILGQYFEAGVSTVYFNGVPAVNPVITSTYIKATVPEGATTGPITVTTSRGTLTSDKTFIVH